MSFKYQNDYDKLSNTCPPDEYIAKIIEPAYRWVFDSIDDKNNFTPQFHKKPIRFLNNDDLTKCKSMGLSFFNDLKGSIERFNELKDNLGDNIYAILGVKIAKGKIDTSDGVNSDFERLGHFTHHPSTTANYPYSFTLSDTQL